MRTVRQYVAAKRDLKQHRARLIEEAFQRALTTGKPQQARTSGMDGETVSYFIPAPPRGKQ